MSHELKKKWLAFYTKPKSEIKTTQRLQKKGYSAYCPVVQTLSQWTDRKKKITKPLFTSYIFVHVDEKRRSQLFDDPGMVATVYHDGKPAVLRDSDIELIHRIEKYGTEVEVSTEKVDVGDEVMIPEGPFRGFIGVINAIDKHRIRVYVEPLDCVVTFKYVEKT